MPKYRKTGCQHRFWRAGYGIHELIIGMIMLGVLGSFLYPLINRVVHERNELAERMRRQQVAMNCVEVITNWKSLELEDFAQSRENLVNRMSWSGDDIEIERFEETDSQRIRFDVTVGTQVSRISSRDVRVSTWRLKTIPEES